MSDPASAFGYLRDGKTYAYCQLDMCCATDVYKCRVVDENDKARWLVSPVLFAEDPKAPETEKRSVKELLAYPKTEGLALVSPKNLADYTQHPPPLTGNLAYGDEITILYREIPPTELPGGVVKTPGTIRIGGKLEGEAPVYVVFPPRDKACAELPGLCGDQELNGVSVSPSGDELAFLAFMHLPSHGASITHLKIKANAFAALVFNDTGMAHHKKREWARAGSLFTRAVYADPTKEVFAYNLACALARQNDQRAEHALRHAISIGGDAVKARARKDDDFASVRDVAWFTACTKAL